MRPLPRSAAEEMILSAVLLPVLVADVKASFHEWIYASDASMKRGAFCEAKVSENVQHPLWLASDFKGNRVSLDPWQRFYLKEAGMFDAEEYLDEDGGFCTVESFEASKNFKGPKAPGTVFRFH